MPGIPLGQFNSEIAKAIYKNSRQLVDILVKSGKVLAKNADKEWAKIVAKKLVEAGTKVPKNILKMLK
jgi:hypothetical protein